MLLLLLSLKDRHNNKYSANSRSVKFFHFISLQCHWLWCVRVQIVLWILAEPHAMKNAQVQWILVKANISRTSKYACEYTNINMYIKFRTTNTFLFNLWKLHFYLINAIWSWSIALNLIFIRLITFNKQEIFTKNSIQMSQISTSFSIIDQFL